MDFDELLTHFKAQAKLEDAMAPILDPTLLMYAAVWPRVTVVRLGEPTNGTWEALWDCVQVDVSNIAMLVDAPLTKAAAMHRRLVALHLIYPDGSMSETVRKVIGKHVMDALKK